MKCYKIVRNLSKKRKERRNHNPQVEGSNPPPGTNSKPRNLAISGFTIS